MSEVIDAHVHLAHNPDWALVDELATCGRIRQAWLMDLSGAELEYASFATRQEVLEAIRRYPDFFVPFGYLDLNGDAGEIDRLKSLGFVGLKPYKPKHPYCDERYFPLYERAQKLGMPILFHTGMVLHGDPGKQSPKLGFGPANMRPCYLDSIAEAFPRLQIIGGHLGYPWLEETAESLYYYPNIHHDLSGYRKDIEWLTRNLDRKCNDGTGRYFSDKILFATDLNYGSAADHANIFKMLDFWTLYFELIGGNYYRWGTPESRAGLMGGNAAGILPNHAHSQNLFPAE